MFRHIVMLTLDPATSDSARQDILDALHTLPDRIPEIRGYSAGLDAGVSDGNTEIVAVGDFDDVEGYLVYRDHAAHKDVIQTFIKPHLAERRAIQYHV